MQIPIVMKQFGRDLTPLAPNSERLVLAQNGMFLERQGPMYTTCTRVYNSDLRLDDHHQRCYLNCGKMPRSLHRAMLAFLRSAHRMHGGEAALVLLYHAERKRFRWHCPPQTVELYESRRRWQASDYIEFDNPIHLPDGYMQLGDAHLHAGPPAPSATDRWDDQDGLHIIVGNIGTVPAYHIDFVMDAVRFRVPPDLFFEDPHCQPFRRSPRGWLDQIDIRYVRHAEPQPAPRHRSTR